MHLAAERRLSWSRWSGWGCHERQHALTERAKSVSTKKTGCPSQPDTPFGKKRALSRYWMAEPPEGVALSDMPLSDAVLDCQIVPVVFVPK
jgi:hypothetical protein